jgi:formylglycine-generating enzyme required for sulfatase activity
VSLSEAFARYLRDRRVTDELPHAAALATTPAVPPGDPRPGDEWLDPVELTPLVWTGHYWLAKRPVERWQFAAFLEVASFAPREVQVPPKRPVLDRARLLAGPEGEPITRLMAGEAILYAAWFGKVLATQHAWRDADPALWGPVHEYGTSVDEGEASSHGPDGDDEETYGEFAVPEGVGFRTALTRLSDTVGGDWLWWLDVRLTAVARR